eukprot:12218343-Heterocapsa_arctica.AAC.1
MSRTAKEEKTDKKRTRVEDELERYQIRKRVKASGGSNRAPDDYSEGMNDSRSRSEGSRRRRSPGS